jgi:hypothetical protein
MAVQSRWREKRRRGAPRCTSNVTPLKACDAICNQHSSTKITGA